MVKEITFKKPTERTNEMMKELLKKEYISFSDKTPNYKQVIYYIMENFGDKISGYNMYEYRAEHHRKNSSGKIIIKTTRSNERKVTLYVKGGDFKSHGRFDSDGSYSIAVDMIEFIVRLVK